MTTTPAETVDEVAAEVKEAWDKEWHCYCTCEISRGRALCGYTGSRHSRHNWPFPLGKVCKSCEGLELKPCPYCGAMSERG
jgi:hypothetical protein